MTPHASLGRRSVSALAWQWAGAILRALLQLLLQLALARLLGPQAWGQVAAVMLVVSLGALWAEAGVPALLVQRQRFTPEALTSLLRQVCVASALVGLALALLAAPLAQALAAWLGAGAGSPVTVSPAMLAAAAVLAPLQALAGLPVAWMQRQFATVGLQALQLGSYAVGYGAVGLPLALAGAGAWSLLAGHGTTLVLTLLLGLWATREGRQGPGWRLRSPASGEAAALASEGARLSAANTLNWGLENLDRLAVARLLGPAGLGAYALATVLARAPLQLLLAATQPVAFAAASRLQDELHRLARGYLAALSAGLLLAAPCFALMALHAGALIRWTVGPEWMAAAPVLAWMSLGLPFQVMLSLTGPMLRATGAVGQEMRAQWHALLVLAGLLAGGAGLDAAGVATPDAFEGQGASLVALAVSVVALMRGIALVRALSRQLGPEVLREADCWRAGRGGLVLAGVALLASLLAGQVVGSGAAAAVLALALTVLAAWLLLRRLGASLMGQPLQELIAARGGDSRTGAWLCAALAVPVRQPSATA